MLFRAFLASGESQLDGVCHFSSRRQLNARLGYYSPMRCLRIMRRAAILRSPIDIAPHFASAFSSSLDHHALIGRKRRTRHFAMLVVFRVTHWCMVTERLPASLFSFAVSFSRSFSPFPARLFQICQEGICYDDGFLIFYDIWRATRSLASVIWGTFDMVQKQELLALLRYFRTLLSALRLPASPLFKRHIQRAIFRDMAFTSYRLPLAGLPRREKCLPVNERYDDDRSRLSRRRLHI